MKTITKHLKRTKTLCENNRKQQLTSTLYWVKFVSYLLLDKAMIILYTLYFNMLYIISFLLTQEVAMIGDSTERKMMRKKAFDNKYLGFKSSTANKAKAMIRIIMPNPLRNIGK